MNRKIQEYFVFLLEADKLKNIVRRNRLSDSTRRENSAEHSWHACIAALALPGFVKTDGLDMQKVMKMLLIHDMVEIDAGDTYLYSDYSLAQKHAKEDAAAQRIFGLLPEGCFDEWYALWKEFDAEQSPEAKAAAALDRLLPILLNYVSQGEAWKEKGVSIKQVQERCSKIAQLSPELWDSVLELLHVAVEKGMLQP